MSLLRDDHVYSFSQLTEFNNCPYSFCMNKIDHEEQSSNIFAETGTLIHDLLDQWAKGKLSVEELPDEYCKRFPNEVITPAPRMLAAKGYEEKNFNLGLDYFRNFDQFRGFKIIGTETKFKTDIEGRPFVGVVDMVMQDEKTGEMIILDHKSKSLSSFRSSEEEMYKQQYVYSKYFFEEYGRYPDRLMFNLFKEGGLKQERPFRKEDYDKTIKWAIDTIERIESYEYIDFIGECKEQPKDNQPDWFCTQLCSFRKLCPNGQKESKSRRKK